MGDSGGSQGLEEHDGATPLRSLELFRSLILEKDSSLHL